jgi:hypothetical protein
MPYDVILARRVLLQVTMYPHAPGGQVVLFLVSRVCVVEELTVLDRVLSQTFVVVAVCLHQQRRGVAGIVKSTKIKSDTQSHRRLLLQQFQPW